MDSIEILQNNFLFQLSLGSKELFHSNLLAWLLDQKNEKDERELFLYFVNKFGGADFTEVKYEQISEIEIAREKGNIDLMLKWEQNNICYFIIIENKMKSLPSIIQLQQYDKKITAIEKTKKSNTIVHKMANKLLLTPYPIGFKFISEDKTKWVNITYENDIQSFLEYAKTLKYKINSTDTSIVISTYIQFIQQLTDLLKELELDSIEAFKLRKYNFYYEKSIDVLRKLRLHDFVLKLAHDHLAKLIADNIKKHCTELIESYDNFKGLDNGVLVHSGFSRSTGLTDIKIHLGKNQLIGLQLQGNTLKYYVETLESSNVEQNIVFAKKLVEKKKWFFNKSSEGGKILYGNGEQKELWLDKYCFSFYSYSQMSFIYLSKDIKNITPFSQMTAHELANYMSEDVVSVLNEIDNYKKLIP
jgi:hypothetical protein